MTRLPQSQVELPQILPALVECMSTGREPTCSEVGALAERIWLEGGRQRSAELSHDPQTVELQRALTIRAARVAMTGSSRG